jgi:hypothetical protein
VLIFNYVIELQSKDLFWAAVGVLSFDEHITPVDAPHVLLQKSLGVSGQMNMFTHNLST